jgi:hypothetical protein
LRSALALDNKNDNDNYRQEEEQEKHYFPTAQIKKRLHTPIRIFVYPCADY